MNKNYMPGKHFLQLPFLQMFLTEFYVRWIILLLTRGPEFSNLANDCLEGIKTILKLNLVLSILHQERAWEAALVIQLKKTT